MKPCVRSASPPVIAAHGAEIGAAYAEAKRRNPRLAFSWPTIGGVSVAQEARATLAAMTDGRCSYCDGYPIDATGEAQIDHFRPKGRPEFYELVCEWTNLFLACSACNKAKGARWDECLLRPDEPGFTFERFFDFRFDSGEMHENPAASDVDRRRAARSIEVFNLNRPGACMRRLEVIKMIRASAVPHDVLAHRFLLPLCL